MKLGIVGSEAAKFTSNTEHLARQVILELFDKYEPEEVISGKCHLGGIDEWAIDLANSHSILTKEYPPAVLSWTNGYKPRNLRIAENSDFVVCITVRDYHPDYAGMKFLDSSDLPFCYHCGMGRDCPPRHVKSGGCWTVKRAKNMGKRGEIIIVG